MNKTITTTPQQRVALAQSTVHLLFSRRHHSTHGTAVRDALRTTVLAGKTARIELRAAA